MEESSSGDDEGVCAAAVCLAPGVRMILLVHWLSSRSGETGEARDGERMPRRGRMARMRGHMPGRGQQGQPEEARGERQRTRSERDHEPGAARDGEPSGEPVPQVVLVRRLAHAELVQRRLGQRDLEHRYSPFQSLDQSLTRTWFVDEGGGRVFRLDSGFVGLDVGTESESISDVVHDSQTTVSITQSIGSDFASVSIT